MAIEADEYYRSHGKLTFIGKEGQEKLQQAKVLVIGAGGLGCPVLQYLAGCGVGVIGMADYDVVAISNLHRQLLYKPEDEGKIKVEVAAAVLEAYNPFINIVPHRILVDETNVLALIDEYELVVDCTDNFMVRYLINDACVVLDKPLVYGAIHQTEGHVTVFNYKNSPTLRCLFPEADNNAVIQSCADIGAYNIITGIIGLMMANEVIKVLLQHPDVLAGTLNQFDAFTGKSRQLKYQHSVGGRQQSIKRFSEGASSTIEISATALAEKMAQREEFILIDVRETDERTVFNIGGIHIPLLELLQDRLTEISPESTIIIYCQRGGRSLQAAQHLKHINFSNVFSLKGGVDGWQARLSS